MRVSTSVTFEFVSCPPVTYRCAVAGAQVATCFARAVRLAQGALLARNWSSVVCVVLERLDAAPEPETGPE
jgi:hypothetical protein